MDDTLYLFVNKHIYTVDSYLCIVGFLTSLLRHNGVIVICMHSFHSAHIFIVCNSVICTNSLNILLWSYCFKLYSRYCVQYTELVCLYTLDIGL